MKAMVTGGGGFIGSHLIEVLKNRGYNTKTFDRSNGFDIRDRGDLRSQMEDCDVVFNLAGVLGTHELNKRKEIPRAIDVNISGAVNVLDVAAEFDVDVVEICKPNPWLNTYSITKEAAEKFTKLYVKEHDLDAWMVRWYNVYGPKQHYGKPQKLVPTVAVDALRGDDINIYGNGEQTADHIYVRDAVRATVDVYETDEMRGEVVDIGSGDDRTVNEIAEMILDFADSDSEIKHIPMRSGEEEETTVRANITKLYSKVGFRPEWSLEEGIKKTVEYYDENLEDLS